MSDKAGDSDHLHILNCSGDISSTTDFIMPAETLLQAITPQTSHKRTLEPMAVDGEPPAKRSMKATIRVGTGFEWNLQAVQMAAEAVESGGKSPVSALNELGLTVTYTMVQQSGPAHCPNFVYTVNSHKKERNMDDCENSMIAKYNEKEPMDELDPIIIDEIGPQIAEPRITVQLGSQIPTYTRKKDIPFDEIPIHHIANWDIEEKHPIMILNELYTVYEFIETGRGGTAHEPIFQIDLKVANMKFEGFGHSKREARSAAAKACLAALLARVGRVLPTDNQTNADFTSDDLEKEPFKTQLDSLPKPLKSDTLMGPPAPPVAAPAAPAPLFGHVGQPSSLPKSPINLLYESHPGLTFTFTYGDGTSLEDPQGPPITLGHSMRYKVVCHIKDTQFEGYGSSKKLAKLAAARSATATLGFGDASSSSDQELPAPGCGFLPQTLGDHIGKLVNEKFNEIMKDDPVHSKRKVLAGIVITTNLSIENARVIAVTTGTKCVSGEHMSVRGRVVNDCHAEVAARRCLQKHFYEQLLQYAHSDNPRKTIESSDLEPIPTGGYQLKPSRHVHLYVSTAPCGDGRIFSPHESTEPANDKHPNRLARGQLRTKIESGEGTIPVKKSSNIVQTWDGVLQGERLLTMSCSDKVARWCVVGLQGALLSHFMKPVYLHCVVLGSLLHPHHLYRAICGRIEKQLARLPQNYTHRRPLLARAASTEARTPQRAPNHSVVWCAHSERENVPEVLNASTGKLENGQPSLLCKQSMFARWQYLVKRLSPIRQEPELGVTPATIPSNTEPLLYSEAKQLSASYQAAKTALIEAFDRAQLGRWIKKPLEQDQFTCELLNADPNALFA